MTIPQFFGHSLQIFGLLLFMLAIELAVPVLFAILSVIVDLWELFVGNEALFFFLVDLFVIVIYFSLVVEEMVQSATALALGLW